MHESLLRIKQANDTKALKTQDQRRHDDLIRSNARINDTVLSSIRSLASFLEGHTTKTEIVNHLKEIGTPDALKVVDAVQDLHQTIKGQEAVDLSPVTDLLRDVLKEAKAIPKDHATIDIPNEVTIKNQVDHSKDFASLLQAVKAIKMVAEAPKVTVKAPEVQVDAPDLTPVQAGLKAVEKAIKSIAFPDIPKTDLAGVEKILNKTNDLLEAIRTRPQDTAGSSAAYKSADGKLVYPTLNEAGEIPVAATPTGLVTQPYDAVDVTYPTSITDVFTFKKNGITTETVTITYTDSTKNKMTGAARS